MILVIKKNDNGHVSANRCKMLETSFAALIIFLVDYKILYSLNYVSCNSTSYGKNVIGTFKRKSRGEYLNTKP